MPADIRLHADDNGVTLTLEDQKGSVAVRLTSEEAIRVAAKLAWFAKVGASVQSAVMRVPNAGGDAC